MRRIHLFELEDQDWFPRSIRDAGTDLLRFIWETGRLYQPIVDRLMHALAATGADRNIDLGSGGGGPVVAIYEELARQGCHVRVTLTDKYPNLAAFRYVRQHALGDVDYAEEPVDATAVPPRLQGFRTLFLALHHFKPQTVGRILQDAVRQGQPIGVFDLSAFPVPPPPAMLLVGNPLGVLAATPFVRPFRWSRLFWTYVVPIVPLYLTWDGFVSGLRLYSVGELRKIVAGLPPNDYVWNIGKEPFPWSITYLIGYARRPGA